jgi:hypothetical protein
MTINTNQPPETEMNSNEQPNRSGYRSLSFILVVSMTVLGIIVLAILIWLGAYDRLAVTRILEEFVDGVPSAEMIPTVNSTGPATAVAEVPADAVPSDPSLLRSAIEKKDRIEVSGIEYRLEPQSHQDAISYRSDDSRCKINIKRTKTASGQDKFLIVVVRAK